jgi:hypothetical protein
MSKDQTSDIPRRELWRLQAFKSLHSCAQQSTFALTLQPFQKG